MSEKTKTLVIITPGFAKDESDTTCLPMQQSLMRRLNKDFPHVNVIVLAFHYPYSRGTYKWFDNTVISFNGRNRGGVYKLFLWRRILNTLKAIHRTNKIYGILSFWYSECAFIGNKLARKYNIKHYCWMWGQDAREGNRYASLGFMKKDQLIVFSDFLQREFEKNYGLQPQHVITPGIDIDEFPSDQVQKDIDIIAAGSLIPLKQYNIFIEVLAQLKKEIPGIKAVLVGNGPEKEKLQDMAESLGLQPNISFVGEVKHSDVLKYMERSKLFLHTSSYEGFGIVCIEALCAGAKVISFVKPMDREIENWSIVRDKEAMIRKSIEVLQKINSCQRVIPFTIGQTTQQIASLFSF